MLEFALVAEGEARPCACCERPLELEPVRVRGDKPWLNDAPPLVWQCFDCALDLDPPALRAAFTQSTVEFGDRAALLARVERRLAAIDARAHGKALACDPAKDPQGRPRVRALVFGIVVSSLHATGKAFRDSLVVQRRLRSDKREYRFDAASGGPVMASYDPAQPLVALVYGVPGRPADALMQANHDRFLWECFARGHPPPVLWLQGVTERTARDKHIPRVREIVARSGYDPDECPTLCCKSIDRDAVRALGALLDEHFDGREFSKNLQRSRGCAAAILREATRGEFESLATTLQWKLTYLRKPADKVVKETLSELRTLLAKKAQHKLLAVLDAYEGRGA
jgi:hypothetical protein